ncbi:MAG TPA: cation:proton antiporter [Solirubrobacterales bacterium]|jgi:Kef-type K+ transport system membrane component KefB
MDFDQVDILIVATVAVLAPVLADLSRRVKVPIVVAEIFLGILVGPHVFGLAETDAFIEALSTFGLAFLFFLAGIEIDFERIRGAPARAGVAGWAISLVLGLLIALALYLTGVIHATILVGLALSTTTLGTLMPILRDAGILDQRFGNFVVGAGAAGEFGPIVVVSVILAFDADEPLRALLLFVFAVIVVVATLFALRARPARVVRLLETTMGTSGQLAVRLSVLLIVALAALASEFGLDVILGAFAAGIVVGIVIRGTEAHEFLGKLDAVGFGFLIPIFFIATGMDYDLDALFSNAASLALVPGFALLFLLTRGLPAVLLYRDQLPAGERISLALFSAAALPLLVAITQIGLDTHTMRTEVAVSLIGAGMISVLVYPLLGLARHRRAERQRVSR